MKKRILSMLLALTMVIGLLPMTAGAEEVSSEPEETVTTPAADAEVYLTVSVKGILASDAEGGAMANRSVTVKDLNEDGILTFDEALVAAHEACCPNGYATATGSYGLSVTKLWGEETYNTLFIRNDVALTAGVADSSSTVKAGDRLYAAVMTDGTYYSDYYTYFNENTVVVMPDEEVTLNLKGYLGMGYGVQAAAISGLTIGTWEKGEFVAINGATTDAEGNVKFSFTEPGIYYVTAEGNVKDVTVTDYTATPDENWNYPTKTVDAPILAPVCVVEVMEVGTCGEELTWTFSSQNGTLTISGIGDMEKYSSPYSTPWFEYKDLIRSVVIESGVTSISQYAFGYVNTTYSCCNLTFVSIADTVTSIGHGAFRYTNVEEVTIPASVTDFGNYIFANNDSLKSVIIESDTTGNYTFNSCSALTTVKFEGSTIGYGVFQKCTALETVDTKNAAIGSSAFNGCTSLHTVTINGESVAASAFAGCTGLCYVYLGKNVTSIGNSAFNNCTGLLLACYAGSESDWAAVSVGSNNTALTDNLVYNVKGQDVSAKPVITRQPAGATWSYKAEADELTVDVTAPEDADLYYAWFYNTENSTKGGTLFTREEACLPDTASANIVGTRYYYAVISMVSDGLVSYVTTEPVAITVQWNELNGAGTEEDPYRLTDVEDLKKLAQYVDEGNECEGLYFHIAADITLPADWEPIGSPKEGVTYIPSISYKNMNLFKGHIDGLKDEKTGECYTITIAKGGKTLVGALVGGSITNLNYYGEKIDGYGVVEYYFNMTSSNAHNILIENVTLKSGSHTKYSGFIGGYASGVNTVTIRNCTVEEGVIIGDDGTFEEWAEELAGRYSYAYGPDKLNHDKTVTGGSYLVQYNDMVGSFAGAFNGTIENCVSYAKVYGRDFVGGIGGFKGQSMGDCIIRNCQFYGEVHSTGDFSGGILGSGYLASSAPNTPCVTIENCAMLGDVYGTNYVGGLTGGNYTATQCWNNGIGYIRGNYVSGSVSGETYVGGIIGYMVALNRYNVISGNYYLEGIADRGIGFVYQVDTSNEAYKKSEIEGDTLYFDTSAGGAFTSVGWYGKYYTDPITGAYVEGIANKNHNRTDDPLGADADKLTASYKNSELKNGTLMRLLNESGAGYVWTTDENGNLTVTTEKHVVRLTCSALNTMSVIETVYRSEGLAQFDSYTVTVTYSDGTTEEVKASDCIIDIDFSVSGEILASLTYGDYSLYFGIKTSADTEPSDEVKAKDVDIMIGWLRVILGDDNVAVMALNDETYNGMTYDTSNISLRSKALIERIRAAYNALSDEAKALVNRLDELEAAEETLNDLEAREEAKSVIELIDNIGEVNFFSAAEIMSVRAAYEALSNEAKAYVSNYETLVRAEEAYAELLKGEDGQSGINGTDGKDGVTPILRINEETNEWEVSYDNGETWKSLGVKATGNDGDDGKDGKDGIDGVDGKNANNVLVIVTLAFAAISLAGTIAMACFVFMKKKK